MGAQRQLSDNPSAPGLTDWQGVQGATLPAGGFGGRAPKGSTWASLNIVLVRAAQYTVRPPLASKVKPVVKLHSREAAKATTAAISAISPVRFMGILSVM